MSKRFKFTSRVIGVTDDNKPSYQPVYHDTLLKRDYNLKQVEDLLNSQYIQIERFDKINEMHVITKTKLENEIKRLKCINEQLEERLEDSGLGIVLRGDC